MFISLDRENMRIVHAHPEARVVSDMATIELSHVHCSVYDADDASTWKFFTDLELKLLYRNTCGQELTGYMRADHIARVAAAVQVLTAIDVNPYEARLQALCLGALPGRYRYVKGSTVPQLMNELFEPVALAAQAPAHIAHSTSAAPAPGRDQHPAATTTPAPAPKAPSAPRAAGSVTGTIYEVADRMWDAKGQPREARAVLQLRKDIMDALEAQHAIKRTTSSSTLGAWQKARLNA